MVQEHKNREGPPQRTAEDSLMSYETIAFPRSAGWQLSDVAVPQCESVAGEQSAATAARVLACMPDVHTLTTIPAPASAAGRDGRWLSAGLSAKLLLGAGALLVVVALLPALFRSKEPADEQIAAQTNTAAPADDMPPLWSGIPEAAPKVDFSKASHVGKSAERSEGSSKPLGGVASTTAPTGPTEKTPDVSVWPDPTRSGLPQSQGQPSHSFAADRAAAAVQTARRPEPYRQDATWPSTNNDGLSDAAAAGGSVTAQANRPAVLNGQPGGSSWMPADGAASAAARTGTSGAVDSYDPWTAADPSRQAHSQYQPRQPYPQGEPGAQQAYYQQYQQYQQSQQSQQSQQYNQAQHNQRYQQSSQAGYEVLPWQPPYQQSQHEQPPYREAQYRAAEQQYGGQRARGYGEGYPPSSRWESQPTSYQVPSPQVSPPVPSWPPQSPAAQSVPPVQQSPPQSWQQPEQQRYQWDYTPDYRRAPSAEGVAPHRQAPSVQPTYDAQSHVQNPGARNPYSYQPYPPQSQAVPSYSPQMDLPQRQHPGGEGYWAGRSNSSAALVERSMPAPPIEQASSPSRYASTAAPTAAPTWGPFDGRGPTAGSEARLGGNTDSIPARASYERAGPGTY